MAVVAIVAFGKVASGDSAVRSVYGVVRRFEPDYLACYTYQLFCQCPIHKRLTRRFMHLSTFLLTPSYAAFGNALAKKLMVVLPGA
jgi:hypothetical protein